MKKLLALSFWLLALCYSLFAQETQFGYFTVNDCGTIFAARRGATICLQYEDRGGRLRGEYRWNGTAWVSTTIPIAGYTAGNLATPTAPSITTVGASGATSYTYRITAKSANGETLASPVTTITTGNATLSTTNFNRLNWVAVPDALNYNVYRTASSGTPSSTGIIGTTSSLTLDDTGLVGGGQAVPTTDTSGTIGGGIFELLSRKGVANGYASLDASALVPSIQIPADHPHITSSGVPAAGACNRAGNIIVDTVTAVGGSAGDFYFCPGGAGTNAKPVKNLGDAYTQRNDGINSSTAAGSTTTRDSGTDGLKLTIWKSAGAFTNQPAGDSIQVLSSAAGDTTQTITIYGTTTAAGYNEQILVKETVTLNGTTAVTTVRTNWSNAQAVVLSASTVGTVTVRKTTGATTIVTLAPATLRASNVDIAVHEAAYANEAQGDISFRGATVWSRLGAGTAGQYLQTAGAGANPAWINPKASHLYQNHCTTIAGNHILAPYSGGVSCATSANEGIMQILASRAGTGKNLRCVSAAAPGAGNTWAFSVRKNAVSQVTTCSISGATATTCSDTVNTFTTVAGDLLGVINVVTGAPALTDVQCIWENEFNA